MRAIDDLGNAGAYSAARGLIHDSLAGAVTPVSPADGHETTATSVVVSWSALSDSVGIATYAVEASRGSAFTSLAFAETVAGSRTSDTLATLYNDTYYWRVRATDGLGNNGAYSAARGFVVDTAVAVVTLSAPADGHETTASEILLRWASVSDSVGIDSYAVEASRNAAFTNMVFTDTVDVALTSDTVTGLYNDTCFWRVRAIDDLSNAGAYSTTHGFVTDTIVNQVALLLPADGHETSTVNFRLSWIAVSDSVGVDSYALEISKISSFTPMAYADTVDGVTITDTFTGLYNDTYFWRVRAVDDLGNGGVYSAARGVLIDTAVSQVTVAAPADGHETTAVAVVLSWIAVASDSSGIDSYVVEVAKQIGFDTTVFADTVRASILADTITGLYNDTYHWRVRVIDHVGNLGVFSITRGFLVDTAVAAVSLLLPADGHETSATEFRLRWSAVSDSAGVDSYALEISKSTAFAPVTYADTVDGSATDDTITGVSNDTYFWRVRAIDDLGNGGAYSAIRGFIADTLVQTAVALAPADGHETTAGQVVVSWSAVPDSVGIASYAVEASKSAAFSTLAFSDTVAGGLTSDTVTGLSNDTYYWRVRVTDDLGNGGAYSTARGFVVDTTAAQVSALAPANGHETTATAIVLSWSAVPADSVGIDSYAVEAARNAAFTAMVFADTVDQALTADTVTGLYNDMYYWRVRAVDGLGNAGAASTPRGFVVDTQAAQVSLSLPSDGHETTATSFLVSWAAVADSVGIDSYALEVSKSAAFGSIAYADTVGGTSLADTIGALDNDTYFWRVRAIDDLGNVGAHSAVRGFLVDTAVAQVALLSPADAHETTAGALTLSWSAIAADSVGVDSYIVEVAKTPAFATTIFADTVDGSLTSDAVTGLYNDTYYWRVRAIDEVGNAGVHSAPRGLMTDTLVQTVSLVAPADGHETTATPISLAWAALSDSVGVDSFAVEVSKNASFTSIVFVDTVDGQALSDTVTGLYNDTYFWRVRAVDDLGNGGAYSATRGFLVDTAVAKVTLVSPPAGTLTGDTTPTLVWNAVTDSAGVDSYALEVSTSSAFAAITFADTVDAALTADTAAPGLDSNTYHWRVRAIDDLGNVGAPSDSLHFRIDTTPTLVTLLSPAAGHETNAVTVRFEWIATSVDTYTWQLSKSPAFSTIVDSAPDTTATTVVRVLSHEDTLYWRVIGLGIGGSDTTAARGILLDTGVAVAVAATPADAHETSAAVPGVGWQALADSVGIDSYAVEVSKSTAFTNVVFADTVDGVRVSDTIPGLHNDTYFWRVRAIDDLGNAGAYSAARGFLVDTVVSQVAAVAPADAHETASGMITVGWTAIADSVGIDSYAVETAKTSAFATTVFADTVDGSQTADTLTGLYNDTHYWRVRAIDDLGNAGAASAARGFLVDTAVTQVALASPADAHETTVTSVVLQVSAVTDSVGIDSYVFEASKTPAFSAIVLADTVDGAVTADTIAGLYNDTYYWRARAVDDLGNAGAYSTVRGFLVDTAVAQVALVAPADGHETANASPVLSWSAVPDSVGIDSYVIEASKTGVFTTTVFADTTDGTNTADTITGLYNDTYFWRVRAIDDLGNAGAYSATRGFLIDTLVSQVSLLLPADGHETTAATFQVRWSAVTADSAGIDSYAIEISRTAAFTALTLADTLDAALTSDTAAGLDNDSYFWRVRAIDNLGNAGAYSAARGFVVDTRTGQPALVAPADAHETSAGSLLVQWAALADSVGIDSFAVEVSRNTAFTALAVADTLAGDATTDTLAGLSSDTYYWRVRAIDDLGNAGAYSAARGFLIDTLAAQVTLAAPADAHETRATTLVLTWNAVADSVGIDSYVIEASKTGVFTTTVFADTTDGTNTADTITGLYNDTYFWRVRAVDDLGNAGAHSASRGFLVDTAVDQVATISPANAHETSVAAVTVRWSALTADSVGVDSYAVEVSRNSAFAPLVFDDTVDAAFASDTVTGLYNDTYFWRVHAVDHLGNGGAYSATAGFLVDTAAARVSLVSPATGSVTSDTTPAFTWNTVADSVGVDSYVIEVSAGPAFATIAYADTEDGAAGADTVTPGLNPGLYYWRVSTVDDLGNRSVPSDSFTLLVDTALPVIALLKPSSGHETNTPAILFEWMGDNAETYTWQLSNTIGFSAVLDSVVDTIGTSVVRTLPAQDTFYWRVIAKSIVGLVDTSTVRGFVLDTSVAQIASSLPADGHETSNAAPRVSWLAVSDSVGIDSYAIEASKTAAFAAIVFADTIDGALTADTITGLHNDTYFWRARAIDDLGNGGAYSAARGFVLDTFTAAVSATAPADAHETSNATPTVSWLAVPDSVGIDSYAIEASKTAAFAVLVFADTIDGALTSGTITGLHNDTYFWRVRAIDDLGNAGAHSQARAFLVDDTAAKVSLASPASGTITGDTTPSLAWTAVTDSVGIDSYALELSAGPAFSTLAFADTVDGARTSDTVLPGLPMDTYFWRVRAIDDLGNRGPASDSFVIRVDTSPTLVTLVRPAAGHETRAATVRFEWTALNADTYTWQLSRTAAFTALADFVTDTTDTFLVRTLPGEDTFFWRVIGLGVGGYDTASARGLLLDTSTRQVTLLAPGDGHETFNALVVASWTAPADSVGIDTYALEVSRSQAFSPLTFTDTVDASMTSATLLGLYNDTYYWRVRAIDLLGNEGAFSAARKIVTLDTSAGRVRLSTPAAQPADMTAQDLDTRAIAVFAVGVDTKEAVFISRVRVTHQGAMPAARIEQAFLYRDAGPAPAALDAQDTLFASGTFSGDAADLSGAPFKIAAGETESLLLVYRFAAGLAEGDTFLAQIAANADLTGAGLVSNSAPQITGAPLASGVFTVRARYPAVVSVNPPNGAFFLPPQDETGILPLRVRFNVPVDPASVTTSTVRLLDANGISRTDSVFFEDSRTVRITAVYADTEWPYGADFSIRVSTSVKDEDAPADSVQTEFVSTFQTLQKAEAEQIVVSSDSKATLKIDSGDIDPSVKGIVVTVVIPTSDDTVLGRALNAVKSNPYLEMLPEEFAIYDYKIRKRDTNDTRALVKLSESEFRNPVDVVMTVRKPTAYLEVKGTPLSFRHLKLAHYNEESGLWEVIEGATLEDHGNTVAIKGPTKTFSLFGVFFAFAPTSVGETFKSFPNPADPFTTYTNAAGQSWQGFQFGWNMPKAGVVTIRIFDFAGQEVRTIGPTAYAAGNLFGDNATLAARVWDGRNGRGQVVLNGAYFVFVEIRYNDGTVERATDRIAVVK